MTNPLDAFKQHIVKPSQLNKPNLILLYGNPGSGKTHLAASISERFVRLIQNPGELLG